MFNGVIIINDPRFSSDGKCQSHQHTPHTTEEKATRSKLSVSIDGYLNKDKTISSIFIHNQRIVSFAQLFMVEYNK